MKNGIVCVSKANNSCVTVLNMQVVADVIWITVIWLVNMPAVAISLKVLG